MPLASESPDLFGSAPAGVGEGRGQEGARLQLDAVLDVEASRAELVWRERNGGKVFARGIIECDAEMIITFYAVKWRLQIGDKSHEAHGGFDSSSVHAKLRAWRKKLPVDDAHVVIRLTLMKTGETLPAGSDPWKHLGTTIYRTLLPMQDILRKKSKSFINRAFPPPPPARPPSTEWVFQVECHPRAQLIGLVWKRHGQTAPAWLVTISLATRDRLSWLSGMNSDAATPRTEDFTSEHKSVIRARVEKLFRERPVAPHDAQALWVSVEKDGKQRIDSDPGFETIDELTGYVVDEVRFMVDGARAGALPAPEWLPDLTPEQRAAYDQYQNRLAKQAQREHQKAEAELARKHANMERLAAEKREKEKRREQERREAELAREKERVAKPAPPPKAKAEPLPPVPVRFDLAPLELQDTALPLADLRRFFLVERAAMWWVSNQSDDLLCLPHCRIQRLDYQVRTALRVLGPLRGRALLSDEVGLGKTIEAGLVLKELVTRGLARRVLVLTVPSLVDQWEEELADKFSLTAATTNHATTRAEGAAFWSAHPLIIASLHTLKQPAHLAAAREVAWDCLIVDEAHHLRNRDSQAWQAVNALPRQFLLLLTATPVQNSLEELYNLVTLLQPGQLPTPKEFRARHMDPKRPRQPREPEELRRLLGQVMIRNTRASSGIELPPRHAETVLFDPEPEERAFWEEWEKELRTALDALPAALSSLWGRLLLQAAGSSPAAWHSMLEKFPDAKLVKAWRQRAPLDASWRRKCALLPPMAQGEGGCVIFTQFLDTQAALGAALTTAGVAVWSINGSTPASERQPIVEKFRREGGALLLTQSGTEGRNLQFCHRLINFDLPWNPMEIEQRIGRLHRMGQKHPVRIYNLVQNGTLQEHLLTILQEKLNLFELVVGETGLVLGEKFSSDEFAEEILRRWRSGGDDVAASFADLGDELAAARAAYGEVKALDETLFANDYETE